MHCEQGVPQSLKPAIEKSELRKQYMLGNPCCKSYVVNTFKKHWLRRICAKCLPSLTKQGSTETGEIP